MGSWNLGNLVNPVCVYEEEGEVEERYVKNAYHSNALIELSVYLAYSGI